MQYSNQSQSKPVVLAFSTDADKCAYSYNGKYNTCELKRLNISDLEIIAVNSQLIDHIVETIAEFHICLKKLYILNLNNNYKRGKK